MSKKVPFNFISRLNGHENKNPNIFVKIKIDEIIRGHDFMRVKGRSGMDVRKYSFPQMTVSMILRFVHVCGFSISQPIPCSQPSELLPPDLMCI